jgi:hypothetical protein
MPSPLPRRGMSCGGSRIFTAHKGALASRSRPLLRTQMRIGMLDRWTGPLQGNNPHAWILAYSYWCSLHWKQRPQCRDSASGTDEAGQEAVCKVWKVTQGTHLSSQSKERSVSRSTISPKRAALEREFHDSSFCAFSPTNMEVSPKVTPSSLPRLFHDASGILRPRRSR